MRVNIRWLGGAALLATACGSSNATTTGAGGSSTGVGSSSAASGSSTSSTSASTAASTGTTSSSSGAGGGSTCGGATCRVDQTCSAGACTFACTGTNVPGDYMTIAEAVGALASTKGAVICLTAKTYVEDGLFLGGDDLTLIGPSPDVTTLQSATSIVTRGKVTIRGVRFGAALFVDGGGADLTAVGDRFDAGVREERYYTGTTNAGATARFDGCDIQGGVFAQDGVPNQQWQGSLGLTIENSYVHDAPTKACVELFLSEMLPAADLHLANNTIVGCEQGVHVNTYGDFIGGTKLTMTLFNNIIANQSKLGVNLDMGAQTIAPETGNNALYGNGANYGGTATPGSGYVKADCLLDKSVPPRPMMGSPCLGAGDAANGTTHDYWGAPRPSKPAIGATE